MGRQRIQGEKEGKIREADGEGAMPEVIPRVTRRVLDWTVGAESLGQKNNSELGTIYILSVNHLDLLPKAL